MVKSTRISTLTGRENTMELNTTQEKLDQWNAWTQGPDRGYPHIQNYFTELTAGEREFLLTGVTPEEWEIAFGGEHDE